MARKTQENPLENMVENRRAAAYLRTSSRTNIGPDKDSERRQRDAIQDHADQVGLEVVKEFNDAAVRGADRLDQRQGFAAMLAYCAKHDVRTVIVENASRFARDLMVQEMGHALLKVQGVTLIAADDPDAFTSDTPTGNMVRQILGAVSEFEKANLVAKLRGARDRKSELRGERIEGRPGYAETNPELMQQVQRLARRNPKTGERRSLREISAELEKEGFKTAKGKAFSASQVQRLLPPSQVEARQKVAQ